MHESLVSGDDCTEVKKKEEEEEEKEGAERRKKEKETAAEEKRMTKDGSGSVGAPCGVLGPGGCYTASRKGTRVGNEGGRGERARDVRRER